MSQIKFTRRQFIKVALLTTPALVMKPKYAESVSLENWEIKFLRDLRVLSLQSPVAMSLLTKYQSKFTANNTTLITTRAELHKLYDETRGSFYDWLSERSRKDFKSGSVVSLDGFIISKTEYDIFSLAAQSILLMIPISKQSIF